MQLIPARERSLPEALALGELLLARAEAQTTAVLAASVVRGPAVILGAKQRTGRVVDLQACADAGVTVLRRKTTGTAAWFGSEGLVFTLALPHVAAIVDDATNRTLLNRNVRPFLKGFTKAGVAAHYFGREWISIRKQPAALLGYEVTRTGAVLIEVFLGFDEPLLLPRKLGTSEENAVDRSPGKTVVSLREVCPEAQLETFANKAIATIVDLVGTGLVEFDPTIDVEAARDVSARDPVPEGLILQPLCRVPIGYLESAVHPDDPKRRWLGGDVLAPTWVYDDVALGKGSAELGDVSIDGASVVDLVNSLTTK